jgi:hypothetical protein
LTTIHEESDVVAHGQGPATEVKKSPPAAVTVCDEGDSASWHEVRLGDTAGAVLPPQAVAAAIRAVTTAIDRIRDIHDSTGHSRPLLDVGDVGARSCKRRSLTKTNGAAV